ncbi:cobalamin biosynthesis protein [Streptomyces sp. 796.1]|uniref:cobalamin biosynthesis protein n=1 Tax=Streptomyces sp. 796.1 TaxID=3163029 RepID=UPI0039C9B10D
MTARPPAADRDPVSVFVGVGASRDAPPAEVAALVAACLAEAGLTAAAVAGFATVDVKADEPALRLAAARYGVPLRAHPAAALAAVAVPHPTRTALAAVGTPSVAEAAALLAAGPGARLVVEKRKSTPVVGPPAATCALAVPAHRGRPRDDAPPVPEADPSALDGTPVAPE